MTSHTLLAVCSLQSVVRFPSCSLARAPQAVLFPRRVKGGASRPSRSCNVWGRSGIPHGPEAGKPCEAVPSSLSVPVEEVLPSRPLYHFLSLPELLCNLENAPMRSEFIRISADLCRPTESTAMKEASFIFEIADF